MERHNLIEIDCRILLTEFPTNIDILHDVCRLKSMNSQLYSLPITPCLVTVLHGALGTLS